MLDLSGMTLRLSWRFTSTETIRLIRDVRMEVGEEGEGVYINTYRYSVITRMTPASRWAAMRDAEAGKRNGSYALVWSASSAARKARLVREWTSPLATFLSHAYRASSLTRAIIS